MITILAIQDSSTPLLPKVIPTGLINLTIDQEGQCRRHPRPATTLLRGRRTTRRKIRTTITTTAIRTVELLLYPMAILPMLAVMEGIPSRLTVRHLCTIIQKSTGRPTMGMFHHTPATRLAEEGDIRGPTLCTFLPPPIPLIIIIFLLSPRSTIPTSAAAMEDTCNTLILVTNLTMVEVPSPVVPTNSFLTFVAPLDPTLACGPKMMTMPSWRS